MKGGVAMMLAAFLQAAEADTPPPGDAVLCLLSDEEAGGDYGARPPGAPSHARCEAMRATTSRGYGA
jgi:acetylornithine deacetylase/succinyl-diaminopimelate desuccinylase-like protein